MILTAPFPPCGILATSVDSSLTGDGNVILLVGLDTRLQVVAVKTYTPSRDDRLEFCVECKLQYGALLTMKVYLTLECDGTSVECTLGYNYTTATCF